MPVTGAPIGGEELSLAGSQDFSPGRCKFSILTPSFLIADPLGDWLFFLRKLLTYLDDLNTRECFNFRGHAHHDNLGNRCRRVFHVCASCE